MMMKMIQCSLLLLPTMGSSVASLVGVPENRWLTNMESVQIPSTNVRSRRVFLSMHYQNLTRNYSLRESLGIFKI